MGACFNTMTCAPILDEQGVHDEFANAQQSDRYENGHSYSGGFGMARGLTFDKREFDSDEAAEEYLQEACQKWEEARCVRINKEGGFDHWLIAAWCAS